MTLQEKFSLHLPYEPKCLVQGEEEMATIIGMSPYLIEYIHQGRQLSEETSFEYCKPMFRPWSHLTQECVQKNYNDGKPFVPFVEIAKIESPRIQGATDRLKNITPFVRGLALNSSAQGVSYEYGDTRIEITRYMDLIFHKKVVSGDDSWVYSQFTNYPKIIQLLLKLHFPVGFEAGEYIEVTNDNNPY